MILKEFAKKYHLDPQELLDLLIFEKFPIQSIEDEIDDRLLKYLLEYTNKKSKHQTKNKKNFKEIKKQSRKQKEERVESFLYAKSTSIAECMKTTNLLASNFINFFLKRKKLYSVNSVLSKEEILEFADESHIKIIELENNTDAVEEVISKKNTSESTQYEVEKRAPIIVIVGHVDHGKTTLLDTIRNQHVAKHEKGGITQHVGAYEIPWKNSSITFLDTPGHEAFTALRARGIAIADIGILVISAEEGIKPQTIESIKMLKELRVQVIVALTKIDRVENKNFDNIFQTLTTYNLVPEPWGGNVPVISVSAIKNIGIDELLETISLVAELAELQVKKEVPATAYILETKMVKGIGVTATILLQEGRLQVGDFFYVDGIWGKVNTLIDTTGKAQKLGYPGHPYTISGFSGFPSVGSSLIQSTLKVAREKAEQFALQKNEAKFQSQYATENEKSSYQIIVKADVFSSLQAIEKSIEALTTNETFLIPKILLSGVGELTENDINFAILSKSIIYLFNIKNPTKKELLDLIEKNGVKILNFDIIYHLLEDVKKQITEEKDKKPVLKKIGDLLILKLFHIKGTGTIVGFKVTQGVAKVGTHAKLLRNKLSIGEGTVRSLQKEKFSVKELAKGNEGALFLDGVDDFKEGDVIELFDKE
jgi:translation initiation factor IF-2